MQQRKGSNCVKRNSIAMALTALIIFAAVCIANNAFAGKRGMHKPGTCSFTANAAFLAGKNEIRDDYWISRGKCSNLVDLALNEQCLDEAKEAYTEGKLLVKDQFHARKDICSSLGESPYDPPIDAVDFVDFAAVIDEGASFTPNTYFPLVPGMQWTYIVTDQDGEAVEEIEVEILAETKEILGVNCIVVRDTVWEIDEAGDLVLVEDTDDWYAQDNLGNVWYFGEISKNYEDGELVDLEGSWKAGREYDMPGILMFAVPEEGVLYRQEFSLGNAEDMAEVAGYIDSLTVRGTMYNNLLKTIEFTPVDPEVIEFKYYAPGVGVVKEEDPESGEVVELTSIVTP